MDEDIRPAAGDQDSTPGAAEPDQAAEAVDAVEADRSEAPGVVAPPASPPPVAPAPSGLPGVDSAVEQLAALDDLPVEDHVDVFDDVQRRLHDALAELDDEQ